MRQMGEMREMRETKHRIRQRRLSSIYSTISHERSVRDLELSRHRCRELVTMGDDDERGPLTLIELMEELMDLSARVAVKITRRFICE